jgi:FAD/FMN-containing dehydrogenase
MNESKVAARDWATLQDAIDGEVAFSDSPAYERVVKPVNARFHEVQPRAIVLCATPQDVSETISFLNRHGLENAVRSGGHCFAGHSSTRGVLVHITPMDSVSVSNGVATIGAGARLGSVYEALQQQDVTSLVGSME